MGRPAAEPASTRCPPLSTPMHSFVDRLIESVLSDLGSAIVQEDKFRTPRTTPNKRKTPKEVKQIALKE
eukprot:4021614-Amphidinium_carterae.1